MKLPPKFSLQKDDKPADPMHEKNKQSRAALAAHSSFRKKNSHIIDAVNANQSVSRADAEAYHKERGQLPVVPGMSADNHPPIVPAHLIEKEGKAAASDNVINYKQMEAEEKAKKQAKLGTATAKYEAQKITDIQVDKPAAAEAPKVDPSTVQFDAKNPEHHRAIMDIKNFRAKFKPTIDKMSSGEGVSLAEAGDYEAARKALNHPMDLDARLAPTPMRGHHILGKDIRKSMPGQEHPHDAGNSTTISEIKQIAHHISEILGAVSAEDLPDWVDAKISKASVMLSDVAHFLDYESASKGLPEDIRKGLKGDWKQEGIELKVGKIGKMHHVSAHKDGVMVGQADFFPHPKHKDVLYPSYTQVDKNYRRKGIASAMYDHAEATFGKKVIPSSEQTEAAEKLWENRKKVTKSEDGLEPELKKELLKAYAHCLAKVDKNNNKEYQRLIKMCAKYGN